AGGAVLDDKAAGALAALGGVGDGKDRVDMGDAGVGNEVLEGVEEVGVAAALGAGTHGARGGAGARVCGGVGGGPFAGREPGDPLALLLCSASQEDGQGAKLLDAEKEGGGGVGLG